jgi:anti-anti-sigma factor
MANDYFEVLQVAGTNVLALRLPESTDSNEFDRLNEQLLEVLVSGPRGRWVVDLAGLHYMGSSALGLMVNIRQCILQSGGELILCGLSAQLHRIFRTCCMERLFRISKTRADALRAIGNS